MSADESLRFGADNSELRRRDLGYAATYLAISLFLLIVVPDARISWWSASGAQPLWVDLVQIGVAVLGQTQRRTRPMVGLTLTTGSLLSGTIVTGVTGIGVLLMFSDLLYCAVLHGSRRTSVIVAVAAAALMALIAMVGLVTGGPAGAARLLLSFAALICVPVLWGREVRQHQEQADTERERAEQTRRLAELDRLAAVAAERASMARDLHDVIAGQLSAIAIQSEAALTIPDPDPATLRTVLTSVRSTSVASLSEMRAMIGLLRADGVGADDPRTAPAGLDRLDTVLDAARASGLTVRVDDHRTADAVPAAVDLAAYRIVQESLTNAAKHAPGSTVDLVLRHDDGMLVVEIDNNLVAQESTVGGTGTGLVGLRERASAVGGRLVAGPAGSRWSVRATLPHGARS